MEHEPSVKDGEDKELVSLSPDSGISLCDPDENPAEKSDLIGQKLMEETVHQHTKAGRDFRNTLDPFFYKYGSPDSRRFTLLKSLSQDSDYSLDSSLFDAEEILQDLGFAGMGDPTIPERFLPSLMQRLSKFPESEMMTLNERILQSIGCFRRKEGKRRLFRNLSMCRDSLVTHYNMGSLACPAVNNYPLLRSNTGPAAFSYDDIPSSVPSNDLKKSDILCNEAATDFSIKESEETLPDSPIAILVSQPSLDVKESKNNSVTPQVSDKIIQNDTSCSSDVKDSKTASTLEKLKYEPSSQKPEDIWHHNREKFENDGFSSNSLDKVEETDSQLLDNANCNFPSGELQSQDLIISDSGETTQIDGFKEETSTLENLLNSELLNTNSIDSSKPLEIGVQCSVQKSLRKTSISQSVDETGKISEMRDILPNLFEISADEHIFSAEKPEGQFQTKFPHSDFPLDARALNYNLCNVASSCTSASNLTEMFSDVSQDLSSKQCNLSNISDEKVNLSNISKGGKSPCGKFLYSRSASLTNFLTSMLNTNDENANSGAHRQDNCLKNKNDDDSFNKLLLTTKEHKDNLTQSNGQQFKADCSETLQEPNISSSSSLPSPTFIDTEPDISSSKIPIRKRGILRRMSSSQGPYFPDENQDTHEPTISAGISKDCDSLSNRTQLRVDAEELSVTMKGVSCDLCQEKKYALSYKSCLCDCFRCGKLPNVPNFVSLSNGDFSRHATCTSSHLFKKRKKYAKRRRVMQCPSAKANFNFHHSVPFPTCSSFHNLNAANCEFSVGYSKDMDYYTVAEHFLPSNICNVCSCDLQNNGKRISHPSEYLLVPRSSTPSRLDFHRQMSTQKSPPSSPRLPSPILANDLFPSRASSEKLNNCFRHSQSCPNKVFCGGAREKCTGKDLNSTHESKVKGLISNNQFYEKEYDPEASGSFYQEQGFQDMSSLPQSPNIIIHDHDCIMDPGNKMQLPALKGDPDSERLCFPCGRKKIATPSLGSANEPLMVKSRGNILLECSASSTKEDKRLIQNVPLKLPNSLPLTQKADAETESSSLLTTEEETIGENDHSESRKMHNKKEAMLERKIRIFSKFLENLGNLSKMTPQNSTAKGRASTCCEIIASRPLSDADKKAKHNNSQRKCATPPPAFDKLLYLLKTIDLKKTTECHIKEPSASDVCRKSKHVSSPVYSSKVLLKVCGLECYPILYSSSVTMDVNIDKEDKRSSAKRLEDITCASTASQRRNLFNVKGDDNSKLAFKEVSKDLEELQMSIQKAKETRISASRELHFLQELLSGDCLNSHQERRILVNESTCRERKSLVTSSNNDFQEDKLSFSEKDSRALSDLKQKSKKDDLEDTEFWQKELKKVKDENDKIWQERLNRMEERLKSQEEELIQAQNENEYLQKQLELQTMGLPCSCKTNTPPNGHTRVDSAFEDDEDCSNHKPSTPTLSTRQDCERLQEQLMKAEQRADELNLLLNQKLIELNKLQITLSKQTKEMIELEKSYIQLQCRFRKGTSKPVVSRLCSRSSPFSSKNLFPKPSPPASPGPTSICP